LDTHSTVTSPHGTAADAHDAHLHHHPRLQHHFDDMEQQKEASGFGMWVFLIQEIMFFGGLFIAYLVYRHRYFPAFGAASSALDIKLGTINTVVLIASSLTMALAVNAAQLGKRIRLMAFIVATMFLGTIFLGIKVVEYSQKYERREIPGANFCFEPPNGPACAGVSEEKEPTLGLVKRYLTSGIGRPPSPAHTAPGATAGTEPGPSHREAEVVPSAPEGGLPSANTGSSERQRSLSGAEIYFSLYFAMTGMHALHMIVGMGVMTWLLILAYKGVFSSTYFTTVENFGLYWHFVDIVWIYLFPLLYLINRRH
jgi:cytochrome c oxidase subunit III